MSDPAEFIRESNRATIMGQGTRGGAGALKCEQSGILHYAPDELYITACAGTTMEALSAEIEKHGQMLACEPMDHRAILASSGAPTLGGAIGVNAEGPRRMRFGAMRDSVLGLKFVDGRGEIIHSGGVVMKNVTGLDLTKFFVGSRGRLGLALEATLKVLPRPKETMSLSFEITPEEVLAKMGAVLRAPTDIAAAEYQEGRLFLRLEGEALDAPRQLIEAQIGRGIEESNDIWRGIRDWEILKDAPEIWRVFGRPSLLAPLAMKTGQPFILARGGSQLVLAISRQALAPLLPSSCIAVCEKGSIGARLPELSEAENTLRQKLIAVFDPEQKFGDLP